jgi:hypothetical protein
MAICLAFLKMHNLYIEDWRRLRGKNMHISSSGSPVFKELCGSPLILSRKQNQGLQSRGHLSSRCDTKRNMKDLTSIQFSVGKSAFSEHNALSYKAKRVCEVHTAIT